MVSHRKKPSVVCWFILCHGFGKKKSVLSNWLVFSVVSHQTAAAVPANHGPTRRTGNVHFVLLSSRSNGAVANPEAESDWYVGRSFFWLLPHFLLNLL